jgi:ferredoxin
VPTVIINDVALEAKVGEKLLNVARRNAAHIGFVCDGNGICQTCQCRVLAGADQLSPPNEAELAWMPERRLADGHRLACQTTLRGTGSVAILTKAEELRRQTLAVVNPPRGEDGLDNLEPLLDNLVRMNVDQLVRYPFNMITALLRLRPETLIWPVRDFERWVDDGTRVTRKMLSGAERLERARGAGEPAALAADGASTAPARTAPSHEEQILSAARALRRARADERRFS